MKLQETSKSYKVLPTAQIRDILRSFFHSSSDLVMTSLSGYILDEKECLGSFGFGTILPTWELKVALKQNTRLLFGTALGTLFDSREKDKYQNRDFLVKAIEEIKKRDDETILDPKLGLFSKDEVLQMKKQIDFFGKLEIESAPVNDLVALLMLYLGLLPGPIFPRSVRLLVAGGGIGNWEKMNDEELVNLAAKVRHAFEGGSGFEKDCSRYFLDFLYLLLNKTDMDSKTLAQAFISRIFFSLSERQLLKMAQPRTVMGTFAPTTSCLSPEEFSGASVVMPRLNLSNGRTMSPPKKEKDRNKKKRRKMEKMADVAPAKKEIQDLESLLEFLIIYYPDVFQSDLSKPLRFFGNEVTTRGFVLTGTLEEERRLLQLELRERESDIDGLVVELDEWKGKADEFLEEAKGKELSVIGLEEIVQQLEAREIELESQIRSEVEARKKEEGVVKSKIEKIEQLEMDLREMENQLDETENRHKCIKYTTDATIAQLQSFLQISEKAHSETSEKLNTTTTTLQRSQSKVEHLQKSSENQEKEIGNLNSKLKFVEKKLTEKDNALMENAEMDQEMRKLMSDLQEQLSNLRDENGFLKKQNQDFTHKLEEEKGFHQNALEEMEENSAQLQAQWVAKEKTIVNELEVVKREHQRELEFQANEKTELKRKTKGLEDERKSLKTNSVEAEKKMNEAVLKLESHLSTLGAERKKCAEAERKNWVLQKKHAEDIRKLKKEVMHLKGVEESLKAQLATMTLPPPPTARLTARGISQVEGMTAREGRMTYRDRSTENLKKEQRMPSARVDPSALRSQKMKLAPMEQEKEKEGGSSSKGPDLLESLAARFQTIRQLETEDLHCDDFESGFDSESDDEDNMFF